MPTMYNEKGESVEAAKEQVEIMEKAGYSKNKPAPILKKAPIKKATPRKPISTSE